ncbi:uncharacterized protein EDB93DRAFT_1243573 [Suillus bovinus]|uniref:uncharacterized protein n=1 Tax=Suillus bovinus TaxID=48563 RepID=UPI001B88129C|nr:uncharacterized protein EDB93DRAFT_1243573 [Suillus bovinus]KAG2128343.1 hypothetical protein EDB93DRAFT_1243573 [Suillus bovinus]
MTCQKCRDADRLSTAARRKRKREQEQEQEAPRPAPSPPAGNIDEGTSQAADPESNDESTLVSIQDGFKEKALRTSFKSSNDVQFHGSYLVPEDPITSEKERVQMAALEVWRTTGYRFRVQHNYPLKTGHKTILWCCQDEDKKQKFRPSQKEGVKHRDTIGMKMGNQINARTLSIRMRHHDAHVPYYDVAMPSDATQIIRDQLEWSSPSSLAPKIQALYPRITASQMSEILWKKDSDQLTSAKMLLDEFGRDIDVFDVELADGVEQLCWGMKKITQRLEGKVVEIGLDATYNTNAKHLELYSVLGEFDNAGFPLSYCLLSTATAIEIGKRTTALRQWTTYLRDKYGIIPRFVHVNKDMAEISMSKSPARANHEFPFIDISFAPAGTADTGEFEGGVLLEPDEIHPEDEAVPSLSICIPNLSQLHSSRDSEPNDVDSVDDEINTNRNPLTIKIKIPKKGLEERSADIHSRVFCPTHLRETVIALIEHHFCAHPLIPGYSHPSAVGIHQWAVKQMYTFCKENNLCEVWAYLWENWYRRGRWELWAQAVAPMEVPRLKTTMIMESHWRRIKVDYLYHFSKPRIDLLAWILVTKLAPSYSKKLDHLLHDTGRFRELSSWRKSFKSEWQRALETPITMPMNAKYRPDVGKWMCTCPHFVKSWFLVCKHLVQDVHIQTLQYSVRGGEDAHENPTGVEGNIFDRENEEVEDEFVDTAAGRMDTRTFQERFEAHIKNLRDFCDGLQYQIQFNDHRMLNAIEREGASFIRLMENCLG